LEAQGSTLLVMHGKPLDVWTKLTERYTITAVTANHDHEPYALQRDAIVAELLREKGITFRTFKDISIFERSEVMKDDAMPYTVFTPYARKWKALFTSAMADPFPSEKELHRLWQTSPVPMASLEQLGCEATDVDVPPAQVDDEILLHYKETRNLPGIAGTSRMSTHLRFGTISPRALVRKALGTSESYLNELIWREFFMQILWHFPHTVTKSFKPKYDTIQWRNDEAEFRKWCEGNTGYPFVDAGMRELNATGFMHNRVRMIVASFLCKHLLIDWRWGEAYFAQKLFDYEQSSNIGNWQWAAGSGVDAAPYFRIFNPTEQIKKFDKDLRYIKKWVPELETSAYPQPIVDHKMARERCLKVFKEAVG